MLKDLLLKNRSYRRFNANRNISQNELKSLIELARLTPSARNLQPLKYILVNKQETRDEIFPLLAWAGYLKDWDGPLPHERPTAYIVVLRDNELTTNHHCDDGIVMQTLLLGAVQMGLGGCILGAFNKAQLIEILNIPDRYAPLYVVAIGEPAEKVVVDELDEDIRYYRDEKDVHHVPKRGLDELILDNL